MAASGKGKMPYMRLYVGDVLSNESLMGLTPAAFGVWMKVLLVMWKAESGTMCKPDKSWQILLGCFSGEYDEVIQELIDNEVGTITRAKGKTTFFSPRLEDEVIRIRSDRQRKRVERVKENDRKPVTDSDPVKVFHQVTGYNPPVFYADIIAKKVQNLAMWEAVCQRWIDSDYKRENVTGMIELYQKEKASPSVPVVKNNVRVCAKCGTESPDKMVGPLCYTCHTEMQND